MPEALEHSRASVIQLQQHAGGELDPQEVLFNHYQILSAAGLTDEANATLEQARDEMNARAARISDADMRQSFLTNVATNARIAQNQPSI